MKRIQKQIFTIIQCLAITVPLALEAQLVEPVNPERLRERARINAQESLNQTAVLVPLEGKIDAATYQIGPGDVFLISINDVDLNVEMIAVSPTGYLIVPGIGKINVNGLVVDEMTRQVADAVHKIFPRAMVSCDLFNLRQIRVGIAGAISVPGLYTATAVSRVSDLVLLAGDIVAYADLSVVRIQHRSNVETTVNLGEYYYHGRIESNPMLLAGDQVTIPFLFEDSGHDHGWGKVFVTGEVQKPGEYPFLDGLLAQSYIAMAGGPTTSGSMKSINVYEPNGRNSGDDMKIRPGSTIQVKQSLKYILVGSSGIFQAILVTTNLYIAYLAIKR